MPYLDPQRELPWQSGSQTSHDAAVRHRNRAATQQAWVSGYVRYRGEDGATQRECSEALGFGRPSCCARFRALELAGQIVKTARRRHGCAVYVCVGR